MIDFFIKRMTVLGHGLVFQQVLVTQTCSYNNNKNKIALQNIDITDFPSKKFFFQEHTNKPALPQPALKKPQKNPQPTAKQQQQQQKQNKAKPHNNNNNKRIHDTSECFDMSFELSKLHVKK